MYAHSEELKKLLCENGASLVGFADLSGIADDELKYGVSVAIRIPPDIVNSIKNAPTLEYYDTYHGLNAKLNSLVRLGAECLQGWGYKACAQTTDSVVEYGLYRTKMPHKTVATRAGLGWIGKSALLITDEYGPAVRISSILTDMILDCAQPIDESKCGDCMVCTNACPGKAISGELWDVTRDRDSFFDAAACRKAARELAAKHIGKEITLCGKCIEVCPYTQKYLAGG